MCSSVYNGGLVVHAVALIGVHGEAVNMEIVITIFYFSLCFCFSRCSGGLGQEGREGAVRGSCVARWWRSVLASASSLCQG